MKFNLFSRIPPLQCNKDKLCPRQTTILLPTHIALFWILQTLRLYRWYQFLLQRPDLAQDSVLLDVVRPSTCQCLSVVKSIGQVYHNELVYIEKPSCTKSADFQHFEIREEADMEIVKNFTHPDFQAKSFTPQKCVICDSFSQINSVNASNINNLGIFGL